MSTELPNTGERKHKHYFIDVSRYTTIDCYRLLSLLGITNPAIQHALKKLMFPGQRGAKDYLKDLKEARDSIDRAIEMAEEDSAAS